MLYFRRREFEEVIQLSQVIKMKTKLIFIFFFAFLLFSFHKVSAAYTPTVDVYRLTSGFYREDWPVIHKDTILWIDSRDGGTVYAYNIKEQKRF